MQELQDNDIVFFNLHRRYLNNVQNFGGFIGIFSLAAFLNQNGFQAQSYAGPLVRGLELLDRACSGGAMMVGLYCDYENVTENIFLCRYIKEKYNLPVIIGGPQATALDEKFLNESGCDAVVRYEGEMTVLELANYFLDGTGDLSKIKGIMYKDASGRVIIQPERELIENLDALPFIDDDCYIDNTFNYNELSIMTGRGCPFHCTFCHEGSHTRKVRFRSVENVLAEIEQFIDKRKHSHNLYIMFTDDTFTLIPDRVKRLCGELKELQKKKPFNWFCEGHIHTLYKHPEMIDYIAEAGAQRLQLGIEAGTQEVLDAYQKGSTIDEIKFVVRRCRDAGIQQVYSNIILGGALFSREVYAKNIEFAKELLTIGKGCVELGAVAFWPLPETAITKNPQKYGIEIIDKDFMTAVGDFPQTKTAQIDKWELLEMVRNMDEVIGKHMINMLKNDEVPKERIISWLPHRDTIKSAGRWWHYLANQPELLAYYQMLESEEAHTLDYFSEDEYDSVHPMRVCSLYGYLKVIDESEVKLFDCNLKAIQKDVLVYATGKLSIAQIAEKLIEIHPDENKDNLKLLLRETLKKLQKHHLVVFSKY